MCLFRLIMRQAAEKSAEIGKNNTEDLLAHESVKGQISGFIESSSQGFSSNILLTVILPTCWFHSKADCPMVVG